jgi:3-phenylpropionate/trans-cinnamate dioxygenase ferredoxin reductase subunit
MDRVLSRVSGTVVSHFFEAQHRSHGVDVRLNALVESIIEKNGRASGVRLASGEIIQAEMIIVGIGIFPSVAPLLQAGATGGNGVAVDAYCRTSLPDIFAVGDCALHVNRFGGSSPRRIESVHNASDLAMTAAKAIVGKPEPHSSTPVFWSTQYDLNLQSAGISIGNEEALVRGQPEARSFSVIYLADGRVVAIEAINAARDFIAGRELVRRGLVVPRSELADTSVPLNRHIPTPG